MDVLIRVAAAAWTASVLGLVLRKHNPELELLLGAAALCAVGCLCAGLFGEIAAFLRKLGDLAGVNAASVGIVLKTVGISIVAKITAGACRDSGHLAVSSAVEIAGCACALYAALPLFETTLDMLLSLSGR